MKKITENNNEKQFSKVYFKRNKIRRQLNGFLTNSRFVGLKTKDGKSMTIVRSNFDCKNGLIDTGHGLIRFSHLKSVKQGGRFINF